MAETGPQKYLAFREQTEDVGNFITDYLAHAENDRAPDEEFRRVYGKTIKVVQQVAGTSYRNALEAGASTAFVYTDCLTAPEQATFRGITGLN